MTLGLQPSLQRWPSIAYEVIHVLKRDISVSFHGRVWVHFRKKKKSDLITCLRKKKNRPTLCQWAEVWVAREVVVVVRTLGFPPGFATS